METDQKRKIFKILGIIILAAILVSIAYFGFSFYEHRGSIPEAFQNARVRAGEISRDVARLSSEANDKITALSSFDVIKEKERALGLINEAKTKNKEAYEKSVALSEELKNMANSLSGINSEKAKQIMYKGISTEISLVTEFIQYTKDMNAFLESATRAIAEDSPGTQFAAQANARAVNERVGTINRLNEEFQKSMQEFETLVK